VGELRVTSAPSATAASVLTQSIARLVPLESVYADDDQPVDVTVKPRVLFEVAVPAMGLPCPGVQHGARYPGRPPQLVNGTNGSSGGANAPRGWTGPEEAEMRSRESVVVAGVDGSPASVVALLHAFTLARPRDGSVEAVTVWEDPTGLASADEERLYRAGHRWAVRAQRAAVARASRLAREVPPLTGVVVRGDPASVLARAGEGASCIVLGRRSDDPLSSACDSTRERCMALAGCPLVVVPSIRPASRRAAEGSAGSGVLL
jgi:nucleotide-binding universal stress UspA family protein